MGGAGLPFTPHPRYVLNSFIFLLCNSTAKICGRMFEKRVDNTSLLSVDGSNVNVSLGHSFCTHNHNFNELTHKMPDGDSNSDSGTH